MFFFNQCTTCNFSKKKQKFPKSYQLWEARSSWLLTRFQKIITFLICTLRDLSIALCFATWFWGWTYDPNRWILHFFWKFEKQLWTKIQFMQISKIYNIHRLGSYLHPQNRVTKHSAIERSRRVHIKNAIIF